MKAAVLSVVLALAVLRMRGDTYIAALLLVESGRIASDGLEAPARHHLVFVDVDVCTPTNNYRMSAHEVAHGINFGRRMDVG